MKTVPKSNPMEQSRLGNGKKKTLYSSSIKRIQSSSCECCSIMVEARLKDSDFFAVYDQKSLKWPGATVQPAN